ncbi:MAG: beta-lactamase family protein [Caldilineaceae bacterium]|nr:beta-lactamase family protein [Caldilineaceae bacterium]
MVIRNSEPHHGDAAHLDPKALEPILDAANFHGAIMVAHRGKPLYAAARGFANIEWGIPNSIDTKFRIGSITKQFTAMAILILQERGLLSVNDVVAAHWAAAPTDWENITLHQLLTHTSGLMHSWALPEFTETMAVPTTLDATLKRFFSRPLLFAPGTEFAYSGVGYFLLAKLIEEVAGMPYDDFLQMAIFTPLGMQETGPDVPEAIIPKRAMGYQRDEDDVVRNAPALYTPVCTGGGHLYSTVQDLVRWDWALTQGQLISRESYTAYYRPERENYAYGWRVGVVEGHRWVSHSGGLPGASAFNQRFLDDQLDIVLLTNLTPRTWEGIPRTIARMVLRILEQDDSLF